MHEARLRNRLPALALCVALTEVSACQAPPAAAATGAADTSAVLAVVRAHIAAENSHDVDAIMRTLADTVQYSVSAVPKPDTLITADRAKQRSMYESAVTHVPDSRWEILDYFVSGHIVATRERMTMTRSGWSDVGSAAYWVQDGVIRHLWLLSSSERQFR